MTRPQSEKRARILRYVRRKGTTSRGEMGAEFSLDKKAVSIIVDDLLGSGILARNGRAGTRPGRPSDLLSLNAGYASVMGIDLGATHVTGILTDLAGTVLDRAFFEIRPGLSVDLILQQMKNIGGRLLSSDRAPGRVTQVGICVPGFVQPSRGVSIVAENIPGWRDVPVRGIFEAAFGTPVIVNDCSRALAMAEKWLGPGRDADDFLVLDLGYGIGMGIMAAGTVYSGSAWKSGEIGHTVVVPRGEPCVCGNLGCLETVASGRAIARKAEAAISARKSRLLGELTHGIAREVTAQDVAIAASMGDAFCRKLLRDAGTAIGGVLACAVNILNPALVVLGGGLVSAGALFTDAIRDGLTQRAMPWIREETRLEVSKLGVDGSARGSALMAAERVIAEV